MIAQQLTAKDARVNIVQRDVMPSSMKKIRVDVSGGSVRGIERSDGGAVSRFRMGYAASLRQFIMDFVYITGSWFIRCDAGNGSHVCCNAKMGHG